MTVMVTNYLVKVGWETVITPVTYRIVGFLKRAEAEDYFDREVKPHVADAWIVHDKTKKGYEIPLTRHFYEYTPLRPLEEIQAEILGLEAEIQQMLKGVMT